MISPGLFESQSSQVCYQFNEVSAARIVPRPGWLSVRAAVAAPRPLAAPASRCWLLSLSLPLSECLCPAQAAALPGGHCSHRRELLQPESLAAEVTVTSCQTVMVPRRGLGRGSH